MSTSGHDVIDCLNRDPRIDRNARAFLRPAVLPPTSTPAPQADPTPPRDFPAR